MSEIRPIRGAQVPNPVREECICVPKVYDWVLLTEETKEDIVLTVGPGGECPNFNTTDPITVECSLTIPPSQTICTPATPNAQCEVLRVSPAEGINGPNAQIVKLQNTVSITFTLTQQQAGGPAVCTITRDVTFCPQRMVLCLPIAADGTFLAGIFCQALAVQCQLLRQQPGPTPNTIELAIEVDVCKEVQVLKDVKLEVLAKFCQPRPPIAPPPTVVCPTITFPEQCDFFPEENCLCQGSVLDSCAPTAVTPALCSLTVNGVAQDGGLQILNATTCSVCAPQNTTVSYTYTSTDLNIVFTANSAEEEDCVTVDGVSITQTVSGAGTAIVDGVVEEAVYTLQLVELAAGTDQWTLTINTSTGTNIVASNLSVPDVNLTLEPCTGFPNGGA